MNCDNYLIRAGPSTHITMNTKSPGDGTQVYLLFVGSKPGCVPYYKRLFGVFSTKQAADEAKDTLKAEEYSTAWRWVEVWNMDTIPRRYR